MRGPAQLYVVEPSGTAYRFFGAVAGKGKQAAKTEIERLNLKEITCREAVREICKILRGLREEEKAYEIEMGWVCDETNRRFQRVPKVGKWAGLRRRGGAIRWGPGVGRGGSKWSSQKGLSLCSGTSVCGTRPAEVSRLSPCVGTSDGPAMSGP